VVTRFLALDLWGPLKGWSFRRLWAASGLSMLADQAFLVALTWLVLRLAGSGAELGAVLAVASVPGAVLMPLGGVLSDRSSPVLIMIGTSVGRVLLLAVLAALILTDVIQLWHVYVISAGLSALDAFYYPASMAIVPSLVNQDRLGAANALIQGVEQASSILGPALAGSLLALAGLGASFGATALLFLVAAALLGTLARAANQAAGLAENQEQEREQSTTRGELVEGLRYVARDPVIRSLLLIVLGTNLAMMGPLYVGGAVLSELRLGGAGAFGTLVAAAGAGSLIGIVSAGSVRRFRRRGLVELSLTGVLGIIVASIAFVPSLAVAIPLAVVIGTIASFLGVITISWLQERAEPGLLGRVMSLVMFSAVALDPISFALAGVLVEVNLEATFVGAGALLLLTASLGATSRTMRLAN
jgi:MFS family permease